MEKISKIFLLIIFGLSIQAFADTHTNYSLSVLPNGATATTQVSNDSTSLIATDLFVQNAIDLSMATAPLNMAVDTVGTISFDSVGSPGAVLRVTTVGGSGNVTAASILVGGGTTTAFKAGDVIGCTMAGSNNDAMFEILTISNGGAATIGIFYGGTGYTAATGCLASPIIYTIPFTFNLSGALGQNETIIMTYGSYLIQSNQWIFCNNSTASHTVTVQIGTATDTATGTGVVLPQGTSNSTCQFVQTDGSTDVWVTNPVTGKVGASTYTDLGARMIISSTAPTLASGGCSTASITTANSTAAFTATNSGTCTGSQPLVFTLPAASHSWHCTARDITQPTYNVLQTGAASTTSVTITNYGIVPGTAAAWVSGDVVEVSCMGY